ncbi:hypothetical protein RND81_10G032800 [Saponaria officinalis]|uniref:23 kDa jasmonate-induced protein-like n=1 Tax=Saponaria officinalis TaxID=3572 RepID=A0AAW1I027_SAPOF
MANAFGVLVDDLKLDGMDRYNKKTKTQEDRAREAMKAQAVAYNEARSYVNGVKDFYGDGTSTLCLIFNGTGETLYYVDDHDWFGILCRTPYPIEIGNGQCASFLHVHDIGPSLRGSEAAVIYRGKQKDGLSRDFVLTWITPFAAWNTNKAYCEMSEVGHSSSWDDIYNRASDSDYTADIHRDGMDVEVSTASGSSPVFSAILSIPYSP